MCLIFRRIKTCLAVEVIHVHLWRSLVERICGSYKNIQSSHTVRLNDRPFEANTVLLFYTKKHSRDIPPQCVVGLLSCKLPGLGDWFRRPVLGMEVFLVALWRSCSSVNCLYLLSCWVFYKHTVFGGHSVSKAHTEGGDKPLLHVCKVNHLRKSEE